MSTPDFQAVEREMAPKLATFQDQINQNEKLFRGVETVYAAREKSSLTPEQKRLNWVYYAGFVRSGAKLDAARQEAPLRDQPAPGRPLHQLQPERAGRRERLRHLPREPGGAVDPAEAYWAFRGRDAGIGALMRKRGFPEPDAPASKGR